MITANEIISRAAYNLGDDTFALIRKDEYLRMLDWRYRQFAARTKTVSSEIEFSTIAGTDKYILYGGVYNTESDISGSEFARVYNNVSDGFQVPIDTPYNSIDEYTVCIIATKDGVQVEIGIEKYVDKIVLHPAVNDVTVNITVSRVVHTSDPVDIFGDNILGFRYVEYDNEKAHEVVFEDLRLLKQRGFSGPNVYFTIYTYDKFYVLEFAHTPDSVKTVRINYFEYPRPGTLSSYDSIPKVNQKYVDYLICGLTLSGLERLEAMAAVGAKNLTIEHLKYFNVRKKEEEQRYEAYCAKAERDMLWFKDITTPVHIKPLRFLTGYDDSADYIIAGRTW